MSRAVPLCPSGTPGCDGQLGSRPLGEMVRDVLGSPTVSQWDTRMGWPAGTKAPGWDRLGCPGQSLCVPVGHRDGMASWNQGPWVG